MEKEKTLIIVDFQKDFCDPNGALYVKGAETAKENIIKAIKSGTYNNVILTVDWHNADDKSFSKNGGQWPVHCVQHTEGAAIDSDIMKALQDAAVEYKIVKKGTNRNIEEYGAFSVIDGSFLYFTCANISGDSICVSIPSAFHDIDYDICGLAGDYCVYETYKNLKRIHGLQLNPLYDCMAFIGEPFKY